ncbi:hypothetical protein EMCRGX_G018572 [Ephydatia muelleri]
MASTSDVERPPSSQPRALPPTATAQPSLLLTPPFSQQQIPAFTSSVPQNPNYDGPEDFLGLVIIITIVCAFLNLLSLVFGMIAIVMAAQARIKKAAYDYPNAQQYSMIGVVMRADSLHLPAEEIPRLILLRFCSQSHCVYF